MPAQAAEVYEAVRCFSEPAYFIDTYCQIVDNVEAGWIPFRLWGFQRGFVSKLETKQLLVVLKARQLGLTWLCLAYVLWLCIFRPQQNILLFSRRDQEAKHLLERLRGMWGQLPGLFHGDIEVVVSNSHSWSLSNGSVVRAFPTTAGDSYTATFVLVDEADLVPDLRRLMSSVKPTIDAGGQMVLLSRVDKRSPRSVFKEIYRSAGGRGGWYSVFLPWHVHPRRDDAWYFEQCRHFLSSTGSLDDMWEQYPATDGEALAARSLDKRILPAWLEQCYVEMPAQAAVLSVPGGVVYRVAEAGRRYVVGVDPAEGNPVSDDSAIEVLDAVSGEEVCSCAGKFEPGVLAGYVAEVATYYNKAAVMVERNNHGHAVLLWLREFSSVRCLAGRDGRLGWLTNSLGKSVLYNVAVEQFRDGETVLHSRETYYELGSIEGGTLSAPAGMADNRAIAYVLALVARLDRNVVVVSTPKLSKKFI